VGFLTSYQPEEKTKWPGKERKNCQEKGKKKDEKGRQKSKACSGSNISLCRGVKEKSQKDEN